VGDHPRRTLEPEAAAEEIVGRAEGAGEGTATSQLQGKVAAESNVRKKMKRREGQRVQVQDQRGLGVAYDLSIPAEGDARDCSEGTLPGDCVHEVRKRLLCFPAHDQVDRGKGAQRGGIHHRCLGAAERDFRLRAQSLDFRSDAKRERIATAYRAEAEEIALEASEAGSGKTAKVSRVPSRLP